jgi:DNA-directed RNA polymerase omega subunit
LEKFDFVDSKFRYAIIAAKRAKQIVRGSKKRIDTEYQNPLNIAIDEIAHGKVNFEIINREELDFDVFEDEFTLQAKNELLMHDSDSKKVSGMKDILMADSGKNKVDENDDSDDDNYDDDDDDSDDDNYDDDDDSDDDNYDDDDDNSDDDDDDDKRNRYDDDDFD